MDELARMMNVLEHATPAERERALAEIVARGAESVPALRRALHLGLGATRPLAAEALVRLGAASLDALAEVVSEPDREARIWAVWALSQIDAPGALPPLLAALEDADPWIRKKAIEGVARAPDIAASRALCRALKDADSTVRQLAAEVLGPRGDFGAVPPLCEALWDASLSVRSAAIRSLGEIGSEAAVPALLERLDDPNRLVRRAAAQALGVLQSAAATRALCRGLTSGDVQYRQAAAEALVEIGRRHRSAALAVGEALCEADERDRKAVAEVLVRIGEASIPVCCGLLQATRVSIRRYGARVLRRLAADAPSPRLREALPLLRREAGWTWGNVDANRTEYREALQAIEAATRDLQHLPLPAGAPPALRRELPIASAAPAEEECALPPDELIAKGSRLDACLAWLSRRLRGRPGPLPNGGDED